MGRRHLTHASGIGYSRAASGPVFHLVKENRMSSQIARIAAVVILLAPAGAGQTQSAPVRTVEDGILDEIVLYTAAVPATPCIGIRLFTASDADLGTGGEGGKGDRQAEAKVI